MSWYWEQMLQSKSRILVHEVNACIFARDMPWLQQPLSTEKLENPWLQQSSSTAVIYRLYLMKKLMFAATSAIRDHLQIIFNEKINVHCHLRNKGSKLKSNKE
jgi:hypothetical protein